jgi:hypothetical protein
MAKTSGLGDNFYFNGVDLSGDINSLSDVSGGPAAIDVTDITQSGMARLGGERDGTIEFISYLDIVAGASHPTLGALVLTDVMLQYCQGTALGNPGAGMIAKQANYDGTRDAKGAITFKVKGNANAYGLEWGAQATSGKRTDTAATNGTGIDLVATTSFGLQTYLQVFSGFAGTSVTVKLQESNDNGGSDPYADTTGGGFTAATGITTQRIATANNQSVKRWLRVVTTGTFTSATFSVLIVKNTVATVF